MQVHQRADPEGHKGAQSACYNPSLACGYMAVHHDLNDLMAEPTLVGSR